MSAERENMDKVMTKVKDLTPQSKQVNLVGKVLELGEEKEITSRFGETRRLVEAKLGDETGTVLLTLWNEQIGQVARDETLSIDNGFVSLVRGHIRLNVGKYGAMSKTDQDVDDVNTSLDVSAVEYEREPRYRSGGYQGGGRREGYGGGGGRQYEYGTQGGGRDRDRRNRGRRRY